MRRFYLQIYFAFLGILLLFGLLVSITWYFLPGVSDEQERLNGIGALVSELIPGPKNPANELQRAVERFANRLSAQVSVRGSDGALLAAAGNPLPGPPWNQMKSGWIHSRGRVPTLALSLADGRWVMVRWRRPYRSLGLLLALVLLALAVGIGAHPVVRRMTRRLERLQQRVEALGAGELTARVDVEGNDEVADLARSFNRSAEQIEKLVNAQRTMLAYASHELRSPLARIQMAAELLMGEDHPELRAGLSKDIAELDELIGELLLASRLEALDRLESTDEVDLLAVLAEEAARIGAEIRGQPILIHGDARMLRRLMRNLLENARRYACGSPIEASIEPLHPAGALLRVADRGPGVPEEERERIFKPFYRPASLRKEDNTGVGLGLALVRQIARHHGGIVRCLPREGGGTCFEVKLQGSPAPPPS
jgi:signal transduction histidine kinase